MKKTITYLDNTKERIDKIISIKLNLSRSQVNQMIKNGHVKINHIIIKKPKTICHAGASITVDIPPPKIIQIQPTKGNLDIIFEDQDILVVNKPPGLPIHPSIGHANDTLINIIIYHYPNLEIFSPINNLIRPGIVHRLDMNTSGLLIIAKNQNSLNILQKDLQKKIWQKKYLALVLNDDQKSRGEIKKNITRHTHYRKQFTTTVLQKGKYAHTIYKNVENYNHNHHHISLVDILIPTGRTHQIRVHLLSENMPIIGDPTYHNKVSHDLSKNLRVKRQLLHAYHISLKHPTTRDTIKFTIDIPPDMKKTIKTIQKR